METIAGYIKRGLDANRCRGTENGMVCCCA
jgi:hypothetical protein